MKHVMYTTPKLNFIHTYGKSCGREAEVKIWDQEMGCLICKTGREYAAFALRKLRQNGVKLERKVVTR